jgi:phosphoglycerate dehydrogenase-like enzyme
MSLTGSEATNEVANEMTLGLPDHINVVVIRDEPEEALGRIRAIAPGRITVTPLWHSLLDELRAQWPPDLVDRFNRTKPTGDEPKGEALNQVLAEAHVALGSFPFPRDLRSRMPGAQWVHWGFAGISNLRPSDFWGSDVVCTSSRGYTGALPIAESALAGALMHARKLDVGVRQTGTREFDAKGYEMTVVDGKTMGIIGLGGIGRHLARLAKGVGMRVVATRRSTPARVENTEGVDVLYPAAQFHDMLAECDFVVVAAMWTPETEGMVDADAFAAMRNGAYLINIARGEIIDEPAMAGALASGKLSGAYLDVYADEFNVPPPAALTSHPHVVMTPHVSQRADVNHIFGLDNFCSNLERLLKGEEMENVIDWERGY